MKEEIEDTKGVKDNTMAKRKRIEGKKTALQNIHINERSSDTNPTKNSG
jgi:hypothetical protein